MYPIYIFKTDAENATYITPLKAGLLRKCGYGEFVFCIRREYEEREFLDGEE